MQSKAEHCTPKQYNAKQSNVKQNNATQCKARTAQTVKAKQSIAMRSNVKTSENSSKVHNQLKDYRENEERKEMQRKQRKERTSNEVHRKQRNEKNVTGMAWDAKCLQGKQHKYKGKDVQRKLTISKKPRNTNKHKSQEVAGYKAM